MAFSVRLTGYSARDGRPILKIEPPWWPAGVLKDDPRARQSVTDGYLDYVITLSPADTLALHARFRAAAGQGVFDCEQWQALIKPMLAELDAALGPNASEFAGFEVCVFEWESGMG